MDTDESEAPASDGTATVGAGKADVKTEREATDVETAAAEAKAKMVREIWDEMSVPMSHPSAYDAVELLKGRGIEDPASLSPDRFRVLDTVKWKKTYYKGYGSYPKISEGQSCVLLYGLCGFADRNQVVAFQHQAVLEGGNTPKKRKRLTAGPSRGTVFPFPAGGEIVALCEGVVDAPLGAQLFGDQFAEFVAVGGTKYEQNTDYGPETELVVFSDWDEDSWAGQKAALAFIKKHRKKGGKATLALCPDDHGGWLKDIGDWVEANPGRREPLDYFTVGAEVEKMMEDKLRDPQIEALAHANNVPFSDIDSTNIGMFLASLGVEVRYNLDTKTMEARPSKSQSLADWAATDDDWLSKFVSRCWEISHSDWKTGRSPRSSRTDKQIRADLLNHCDDIGNSVHPMRHWMASNSIASSVPPINVHPLMGYRTPKPNPNISDDIWAEYVYYVAWYMLKAAVGCLTSEVPPFFREAPVFIGGQNLGKSQLPKNLLPVRMNHWRGKLEPTMDIGGRDMLIYCEGKIFVEVAEGLTLSRKTMDEWKSFLSEPDYEYTMKHINATKRVPRTFIIYFTTNKATPMPPDPSGQSRFLPIKLEANWEWAEQPKISQHVQGNMNRLVFGEVAGSWTAANKSFFWSGARALWKRDKASGLHLPAHLEDVHKQVCGGAVATSDDEESMTAYLIDPRSRKEAAEKDEYGKLYAFTEEDFLRLVGALKMDGTERYRFSRSHMRSQMEEHGFVKLPAEVTRVRTAIFDKDASPKIQHKLRTIYWNEQLCEGDLAKARTHAGELALWIEGRMNSEQDLFT